MPAADFVHPKLKEECVAQVMIGIDPHKGSHTAVALDEAEKKLGEIRVRADVAQVEGLLSWAKAWPKRTWAVEGARGLGHLLAQQLLAAGERVIDVQPKLAARVRLLDSGDINKNDPNDARSVAVAALRSSGLSEVRCEDHTDVMKLWSKRHRDLSQARNRIVCQLHSLLCELVPGGAQKDISAAQAARVLDAVEPQIPTSDARAELAGALLEDLRRVDHQRREAKKQIAKIVKASKTTLTSIYGVGPVVAATVIGYVGDVSRFSSRDRFAAYNGTAPIEASSGSYSVYRLSRRGNRQMNHAIHMAAVTQISHRGTEGRAYYERKIAEGMTHKCALRSLKRRISDAVYTHLVADASGVVAELEQDPGGQSGNDSSSSVAGSNPETPTLRRSHSRVRPNSRTVTSKLRSAGASTRTRKTRKAS